jgi:hypothetical protein
MLHHFDSGFISWGYQSVQRMFLMRSMKNLDINFLTPYDQGRRWIATRKPAALLFPRPWPVIHWDR